MLGLFEGVKKLIKLEQTKIDNNIFRLHYKVTVLILITFSLIITAKQYIGDPIDCIMENKNQEVIDAFCWIQSTYTVPSKFGKVGKHNIAPGVAGYDKNNDKIVKHKYYQWVCFTLFFQAILFYIPRFLWKSWEGGRMKILSVDLKFGSVTSDDMKEKCQLLCEYFTRNMKRNNEYFYKFVFCEFLNLVNVIGQIFFMDLFLGGAFLKYGIEVLSFIQEDYTERTDAMHYVFPKVTKCDYRNFGPSGDKQDFDALCILPLNVVNEYTYLILWFWFIILSAITGLGIIYRLVVIASPLLRFTLLRSRARMVKATDIEYLCRQSKIGDWFLLYQASHNIDPFVFKQMLQFISECLKTPQSPCTQQTSVEMEGVTYKI